MSFSVAAASYDRFMGRYSDPLAVPFADLALLERGQRVLDVGCGPGALLSELVHRLGAEHVAGVDPSDSFVDAARRRHPRAVVESASAESMPFDDDTFDVALAQLVVHFMTDPVAGLGEMARVAKPGGIVAACVWDFHEGGSPLSAFWSAVGDLDPDAPGEGALPGTRRGHLGELFEAAGLRDVHETKLTVDVEHATFDDWWEPYELGVGPAGAYVAELDTSRRRRLAEYCRERLGPGPFTIDASAWAARGTVA